MSRKAVFLLIGWVFTQLALTPAGATSTAGGDHFIVNKATSDGAVFSAAVSPAHIGDVTTSEPCACTGPLAPLFGRRAGAKAPVPRRSTGPGLFDNGNRQDCKGVRQKGGVKGRAGLNFEGPRALRSTRRDRRAGDDFCND